MNRRDAAILIEGIESSGKRLYDNEVSFLRQIKGSSSVPTKEQSMWVQKIYCRVYGGGQYQHKEM